MVRQGIIVPGEERSRYSWWREGDWHDLERAGDFRDLVPIALRVLERMPQPIAQVCGPISTGGLGSIRENFEVFQREIRALEDGGVIVFNQAPFEPRMWEFKQRQGSGADIAILEEFYLPVFESGLIRELHFMPNWQSSFGARWEHEQAQRLGLKVEYL